MKTSINIFCQRLRIFSGHPAPVPSRSSVPRFSFFAAIVLALTMPCDARADADKPSQITFGTDSEATSLHGLAQRKIYGEAFQRLGISFKLLIAPLKRIEFLLANGQIDGEWARAPAYGKQHPELLALDFAVNQIVFSLYALKPVPGLTQLSDLQNSNFTGIARRGVLFCEKALKPLLPAGHFSEVASAAQSVAMLKLGHGDFYCDVSSSLENEQFSKDFAKVSDLKKLFDISNALPNNAYLAPKHRALIAPLTATLKQMEKEGLIARFKREAELEIRALNGLPAMPDSK